jgi:hypothetical protein
VSSVPLLWEKKKTRQVEYEEENAIAACKVLHYVFPTTIISRLGAM